jgi:hypothetical protein
MAYAFEAAGGAKWHAARYWKRRLSVRRCAAGAAVRSSSALPGGVFSIACRYRRETQRGKRLQEGELQMSHIQLYEQGDMDYGTDNFRRSSELKFSRKKRAEHGRKRGKTPTSVNGIHRRRNRKMAW